MLKTESSQKHFEMLQLKVFSLNSCFFLTLRSALSSTTKYAFVRHLVQDSTITVLNIISTVTKFPFTSCLTLCKQFFVQLDAVINKLDPKTTTFRIVYNAGIMNKVDQQWRHLEHFHNRPIFS